MQKQKSWGQKLKHLFVLIILFGGIYVALSLTVLLDFHIDMLWFRSLGYEHYFLMRLIYRYLVFGGVAFIFSLIFFLNFWIASRFLGTTVLSAEKTEAKKRQKYRNLIKMFQQGSLKVYTPVSVLLAILIAIPLFRQWETFLLFIFGPDAGIRDLSYGKDISYYIFSYPVFTLIQKELLITFILLFLGIALLYIREVRLLPKESRRLSRGAKTHLTILALIICLIQVWGYVLQIHALLYTNNHHPLFSGPGWMEGVFDYWSLCLIIIFFTGTALSAILLELYARKRTWEMMLFFFGSCFLLVLGIRSTPLLPKNIGEYLIKINIILSVLTFLSLGLFIYSRKNIWKMIFYMSGICFLLAIGGILPRMLNDIWVKPNEARLEKPYIERSIKSTSAAFNLNKIETRDYKIERRTDLFNETDMQQSFRNIPLWDRDLLDEVYTELQAPQDYYSFSGVDVDRYTVKGVYQQVYMAARELNLNVFNGSPRDNWQNRHLKYTHGYGVVMTPASHIGDGKDWYIHNMPLTSEYGFDIKQPGIYYGLENYDYAIVPNKINEIDYPGEKENIQTDYKGKGGVPIPSFAFFRKLLFSVYFNFHKSRNILMTMETTDESRLLFRRNIAKCIQQITPFFMLDDDPYIVVTSKGLFWIQDAYTTSDRYPNAELYDNKFNYIRNSVKVVVNAYNGDVTYYISDPNDLIIQAYKRIYPAFQKFRGLLRDMDQMDPELREHIRYPKMLFDAQMAIYARYNQTNPDSFYSQEDKWEFAQVSRDTVKSYYMTLDLFERSKYEFLLISPMKPEGRENMRALAIARCDGENYGKVIVYSFSRGDQVINGPSQIMAKINSDPVISQELTLWDQHGSHVKQGKMVILPINNSIFYIQPIYLIPATEPKIPKLLQIIISDGISVTMDASLEGAVQKLIKKSGGVVPSNINIQPQQTKPDKKSEDVKSESDEKPADVKTEPDKEPADVKSEPDKKPADVKSESDEKPADVKSEPDKEPADLKSESDEKPADVKSEPDEKPADLKSESDEKPEDVKSEPDEKPADVKSEPEKMP